MKVYQVLGDIKLEFDDSHLKYASETYRRTLDLDSATVKVSYSVGDVEFTREHFASYPDQAIITRISGSKPGSLSFTVSLDSKLEHQSQASGTNQIIMQGSCYGRWVAPKYEEGIKFYSALDLQISDARGSIHVLDGNKLVVEGSDWVVLRLVAASSFDGPFTKPSDSKKDPKSDALNALKSIEKMSYSDLYARHLNDYQQIFHRVSLLLSKSPTTMFGNGSKESEQSASEDDTIPTAQRVKSFKTDEDPALVELLFQFGRYLLISSSRPGSQATNLQGIWSKDLSPAWEYVSALLFNFDSLLLFLSCPVLGI